MRAGEDITVKVTIARDGHVVSDGEVAARFYAPGQDPSATLPRHEAGCVFDPRSHRWKASVPTAGWEPGTWTVVVGITGSGRAWLTQRFPLAG